MMKKVHCVIVSVKTKRSMLSNYRYIQAEIHIHQLNCFSAGIVNPGIVQPQDMGQDFVSVFVGHDVQDALRSSKAKPDFRAWCD